MYLRVPEKAVLERIRPTFEKSKVGHFFCFFMYLRSICRYIFLFLCVKFLNFEKKEKTLKVPILKGFSRV